jgi:hypothetical protein
MVLIFRFILLILSILYFYFIAAVLHLVYTFDNEFNVKLKILISNKSVKQNKIKY